MIARRIFTGLILILFLGVLELNQNRLVGWILAIALTALFVVAFEAGWLEKTAWLKVGAWVAWLGLLVAILFLTWPPVRRVPAVSAKNPAKTGVVSLKDGDVSGVYTEDQAVEVFTGIPYAAPPVGDRRWKAPEDPEPWEGVLECDSFAPMGYQTTNLPIYDSLVKIIGYHDYKWLNMSDNYVPPVSEDSLYVNVWKPAGDKKDLPVLVYVHGGSLQTGQPWYEDYNGETLASRGVIVVNFSYRLGVFGFLALEELQAESETGTTGNYGLLDQIKALEWVRDNIAAFGGDPDNVTVAGESAGSASVSALAVSPLTKGLFRRIILESSTVASKEPPHSFRLLDEALEAGEKVKEKYGCKTVEELRALPASRIVKSLETEHHITVDGYVLTKHPYDSYFAGEVNAEQILHGYNSKESGPFILFSKTTMENYEGKVRGYFKEYADDVLKVYAPTTDAEAEEYWAEIYGAVFFDYPHWCLARIASWRGIPTYEYYFSKDNGRLGSWHSGEEVYCYGNIPEDSKLFDDSDRALMQFMTTYWVNFAKTGDPNGEDTPYWPKNDDTASILELGDTVHVIDETPRKKALFEVLDRMQGFVIRKVFE